MEKKILITISVVAVLVLITVGFFLWSTKNHPSQQNFPQGMNGTNGMDGQPPIYGNDSMRTLSQNETALNGERRMPPEMPNSTVEG